MEQRILQSHLFITLVLSVHYIFGREIRTSLQAGKMAGNYLVDYTLCE